MQDEGKTPWYEMKFVWDENKFHEMFAEAQVEAEHYMAELFAALRECNSGGEFPRTKERFESAHRHYERAVALNAQLSIMMGKRMKGKQLRDWTWQQGADNGLVSGLSKLLSGSMNGILAAYSPFLRRAQLVHEKQVEEIDAE